MADIVAIGLGALAFGAALQAAGVPIFNRLIDPRFDQAARAARRIAVASAVAGLMLTITHAVVQPARLTGELSGLLDPSLHALLLASDAGTAAAVRLLGLALILGGSLKPTRAGETAALTGAALVTASFAFTGHTAADAQRWLLAPLLIVHLFVVAFWFGALLLLLAAVRREAPAVAGEILGNFSRAAAWLVPVILIAGIALASLLLAGWSSLRSPYGLGLAAKVAGFALLLALATANKWRFVPRLARGDGSAAQALEHSILVEWLLILAVVSVTAVMTALFSPQH